MSRSAGVADNVRLSSRLHHRGSNITRLCWRPPPAGGRHHRRRRSQVVVIEDESPRAPAMTTGHGPCKPVNEMVLDSRTGEEEAGNGAVLAEPRYRLRMDADGVSKTRARAHSCGYIGSHKERRKGH
jgi:hypothetical protein